MPYVDFAELKTKVSIHQVAMSMLGLKLTQKGDQFRGQCPIHQGGNPRGFVITTTKNLWHCFDGCGGGDQITLVARIRGLKVPEELPKAAHEIAEHFGTVHVSPAGTNKPAPTAPAPLPQSREARAFDGEAYAKSLDPTHASLAPLGISEETYRAFKSGYSSSGVNRGRLAMPVCDKTGVILAFCGKALKDEQPALIFPKNFDPRGRLFGWDRVPDGEEFVTVCLDPVQVLTAYQNGIENAVACLGPLDSVTLDALSVWMQEKDIKFIEPL